MTLAGQAMTAEARSACLQVKYLEVIPLIAAQLIKKGDFLAPAYPNQRYGYGCVLYDNVCDFSKQGAQPPRLSYAEEYAETGTSCLLCTLV